MKVYALQKYIDGCWHTLGIFKNLKTAEQVVKLFELTEQLEIVEHEVIE
jgi:hypothetical protein